MDSDVTRKENKTTEQSSELGDDDRSVLQSIRVRCSSVLVLPFDWESLVRQFHYVWYSGTILWALVLLSLSIPGQ